MFLFVLRIKYISVERKRGEIGNLETDFYFFCIFAVERLIFFVYGKYV